MVNHDADNELLELAKRLARAERTKDIAALQTLIADDYSGIGASGELLTKKAILERFSNSALAIDQHKVGEIQVRVVESIGLIIGVVHLRGALAGQVFDGQFRFMDVAAKRSGQWQIVASQLTPKAQVVMQTKGE